MNIRKNKGVCLLAIMFICIVILSTSLVPKVNAEVYDSDTDYMATATQSKEEKELLISPTAMVVAMLIVAFVYGFIQKMKEK